MAAPFGGSGARRKVVPQREARDDVDDPNDGKPDNQGIHPATIAASAPADSIP